MSLVVTVVAPAGKAIPAPILRQVKEALAVKGGTFGDIAWLSPDRAFDLTFDGVKEDAARIALALLTTEVDIAVQPAEGRRKKVLVADMDSTMIQLESLDKLAYELGFGPEVEEITERGMRGELDFRDSLRSRVALLKGQEAKAAMAKVLADIPYTDGAEVTVKTLAAQGCHCILVSGGFTFTTEVVYQKLGFHEHHANELEIIDGHLTGKVIEPILGRDSKLATLEKTCGECGLPLSAACAIGDGANDLDMIQAAGMGVGYHGKPILRQKAAFNINHGDLTTLLYFQGYSDADFVEL